MNVSKLFRLSEEANSKGDAAYDQGCNEDAYRFWHKSLEYRRLTLEILRNSGELENFKKDGGNF